MSDENAPAGAAEAVYRAILRGIIEGEHASRSWLKERDLSERYDVSRIPVREALQRLEVEGFVQTSRHRGVTVSPVMRTDIDDIFDLRLCIEPFAAQRAAERVAAGIETPADLARFLQAATVDDTNVARIASLDFHSEVVRMSGNPRLARSLMPVRGRLEWIFRMTKNERANEHDVEHEQIFAAIASGEGQAAAALTSAHISLGRAPVLAALSDVLDE